MAGPTSVRFCNEMLELCGYQEDALNEWKQRIQEGDSCTREQYIQIEKGTAGAARDPGKNHGLF